MQIHQVTRTFLEDGFDEYTKVIATYLDVTTANTHAAEAQKFSDQLVMECGQLGGFEGINPFDPAGRADKTSQYQVTSFELNTQPRTHFEPVLLTGVSEAARTLLTPDTRFITAIEAELRLGEERTVESRTKLLSFGYRGQEFHLWLTSATTFGKVMEDPTELMGYYVDIDRGARASGLFDLSPAEREQEVARKKGIEHRDPSRYDASVPYFEWTLGEAVMLDAKGASFTDYSECCEHLARVVDNRQRIARNRNRGDAQDLAVLAI